MGGKFAFVRRFGYDAIANPVSEIHWPKFLQLSLQPAPFCLLEAEHKSCKLPG